MILGTGIDIVMTKRFSTWKNDDKILNRFFHPKEVEYIVSLKNNFEEAIAARFAAKEAFGKALGTGLKGINLKDICVKKDKNGKPYIEVFNSALEVFNANKDAKIHLAISHEKEYAGALVILEK